MDNPIQPSCEQEALQWLLPSMDRSLHEVPKAEFLKAWSALFYLYGGLHPDGAFDHGAQLDHTNDGSERFNRIEPRLIAPSYASSGWPVVLVPLADEAWRRYELDQITDDEMYCADAQYAGMEARMNDCSHAQE
jgi:DNA (cytosine-5)-methyltransferase 1